MGIGDDEDGYGFARRGRPEPKKVGRRTAVPAAPPPSARQRFSQSLNLAGDYAPISQKPAWIWLLIGLLLGTGGTLLTSSFWLPESQTRNFAEYQANDRLPAGGGQVAVAAEATSASEALDAAPDESTPVSTAMAALDVEEQGLAARPRAERRGEALLGPAPSADALGMEPKGRAATALDAEELEPAPSREARAQALDADDVERSTIAAGSAREGSTASEEAIAMLISKPKVREEKRGEQEGLDTDRRTPVDQSLAPPAPAPSKPTLEVATTATSRPATAPLGNDSVRRTDQLPTIEEASPTSTAQTVSAVPDDLPPRVRQALLETKSGTPTSSASAVGGDGRIYRVQLAAVADEAAAEVYWREVNDRLPGVFADVEPIFNQREVNERLYLRIWVGSFKSRGDADGYCGWLREQGQDCFVTRVDNL